VNNPLSNLNVSLIAQDIQNLALASRLEQLMKLNTTAAIMNQENVTRILGTFDNIKVHISQFLLNDYSTFRINVKTISLLWI
jgi:hypothetical protein